MEVRLWIVLVVGSGIVDGMLKDLYGRFQVGGGQMRHFSQIQKAHGGDLGKRGEKMRRELSLAKAVGERTN
jgi:hypothetical protein